MQPLLTYIFPELLAFRNPEPPNQFNLIPYLSLGNGPLEYGNYLAVPPATPTYIGFDWLRVTMDRMALGGRPETDSSLVPVEHARMKTSYWVEKLVTQDLSNEDSARWQSMTCALFDGRWSGTSEPSLLSIHLPASEKLIIFELATQDDALEVKQVWDVPALAAVALRIT
ncbi:hypothetical protein C8F01DRAFT_487151 [Mycena amicta]|nr:hypothetical protein C8F01DRAFT_487151 [Mycena amicta]